MGTPKISEENKNFLMDSIRELEIDKQIIEKSKADMLIMLLMKKFKKLPTRYKEEIKKLSEETIDLIAMDIFDLNSVEDLDQYL